MNCKNEDHFKHSVKMRTILTFGQNKDHPQQTLRK